MAQVKRPPAVVVFYEKDAKAAKEATAGLQAEGFNTLLIDVNSWYPDEDLGAVRAIILPDVDASWDDKIKGQFNRVDRHGEPEPVKEEEVDETPDIPENWQDLDWAEMRELAQSLAPDEAIKSKAHARKVIEAKLNG